MTAMTPTTIIPTTSTRIAFPALALLLAVLASAALSSCAPLKGDPQIAATPDRVSLMMAQAADRASVAMETLAAVEQARSPGIAVAPIADAPPELQRALTISWTGPVEPLAKKLAERAGYSFQSMGAAPPVPIVVTINVENMPVIDIMRSVGLQLGVRADLKVDANNRIVEIHYAPVTGLGD
jgi:defect-in-organelle-trafficking protein DotD